MPTAPRALAVGELLTTAETAGAVRLSPKTLSNMRSAGTGPAYVKLAGRILYRAEDLAAYIAARLVTPGAAA